MLTSTLLLILIGCSVAMYFVGRSRSIALVGGRSGISKLNSLPGHYGLWVAAWCLLPALAIVLAWNVFGHRLIVSTVVSQATSVTTPMSSGQRSLLLSDIQNVEDGTVPLALASPSVKAAAFEFRRLEQLSHSAVAVLALCVMLFAGGFTWHRLSPTVRARHAVEKVFRVGLAACSTLAIFITIGIVASVLFEALRFFHLVPVTDFLFGTHWSPQMAIRADQVGSSGAFGAVPLFLGTLVISVVAMGVSIPIGLFAAIYLAEYANRRVRAIAKPLLELLAGIPTVVYGFFAALTVGPLLVNFGRVMGVAVAPESGLAAGLVMGVMIIPFVSSLADDMITAVPKALRDGSLALGATRSETIRKVVLRAALPGIAGGVLLAVSRAIGETMIVVMAAGLTGTMTANPFRSVTTVTVQIVQLLVGDSEFDSPKTLAAFALGLVLFVATLALNFIALVIVRKYREQYE